VRRERDISQLQFLEAFEVLEDAVEVGLDRVYFLVGKIEPGQFGQFQKFFAGDRHGRILAQR
jgi:hypothetical protein